MPRPPEPDPGFWKRWLRRWRKKHPLPKPKPRPKPKPPPEPPAPPPSWTIGGPILLCTDAPDSYDQALDPNTGQPRKGIAAIGQVVVPGVSPLWRIDTLTGPPRTGWLGQIEDRTQIAIARSLLIGKPASDSKAVVVTANIVTLGADALDELDEMRQATGVNTAFAEVNAQVDGPPGRIANMLFQTRQDGYQHVSVSFGVYGGVPLEHYLAELAGLPDAKEIGSGWMVFSTNGMSDTDSWAALAAL